jgi:hypothetical protein
LQRLTDFWRFGSQLFQQDAWFGFHFRDHRHVVEQRSRHSRLSLLACNAKKDFVEEVFRGFEVAVLDRGRGFVELSFSLV